MPISFKNSVYVLLLSACIVGASIGDCPVGDLNSDCRVDWIDVELFASQWLDPGCAGAGCADFDGISGVNVRDFAYLAASWLEEFQQNTVVINEFMAKNDGSVLDEYGDADDWIELYNYGERPVDVGGLYIADRLTTGLMWRIPDDSPSSTTIPAGGFLLIWADDEANQGPLHVGFKLGVGGEQIGLYDPDKILIDGITFGAQVGDESYGRLPDGADNWQVFSSPTPGASNSSISVPRIVINEIMYHPYHEEDTPENTGEEYIELYNASNRTVDLSGWRFSDGVDFTFPQITISASSYLVVAADVNSFTQKYPVANNVIGGWQGRLSNSGENIDLVDNLGVRMDAVEYSDQGDWVLRELGPVDYYHRGWMWSDAHDGDGKSLELINPLMPNEYGQNWSVSDSNDGTPGSENPIISQNIAPLMSDVSHYPAVPGPEDEVTVAVRIIVTVHSF